MATISSGNLILLRTSIQKSIPYLSILQPVVLLSALVNNSSIARGARSIAYNTGGGTGYATIAAGMILEVDTSTGTRRIRVKSITGNQSSGTVTVDENAIDWGDNNAIRIYHNYQPVPIPPVIRSQVFYKFYNVAYSDQNEEPNPVAIAGTHRSGFLSAGSIVFDLDATDSYAIAQGATISSRAWSCVKNGGGTSGITIASASSAITTMTITEPGQYWLTLTVTDSNGKTQTTHRAIFVHDASYMPYINFTIQNFTGDWASGGWQLGLNVTGDVTLSEFPDWTLVVLWNVHYFGNSEDYVNLWEVSDNILITGYLRKDTDTDNFNNGTGAVSFSITTIDDLINNVSEMGSVSLNATSNPNKWYQYSSWMTTGRAIHHLLKWQSWGIFDTCDVYGLTTNTLKVKNTDFTEATLLQQINSLAYNRGIFAKLICDRLGRLHLVADSQMLNNTQRAALDTVFIISESDISGTVDLVRSPEETVAFTQIDGFAFNGSVSTPYISVVPAYRENDVSFYVPELRGSGTVAVSNQIFVDQTDSNEKVGRYHALQNNNPQELRFTTPSNYIGAFDIIPSIGWYEWGIPDDDLKRNTELYGRLFVCRNISHQFVYDNSVFTGQIQTSVVLEPEAIGPDGIQGNYPTGYPAVVPPVPEPSGESPSFLYAYSDLTYSPSAAALIGAGTTNPLVVNSASVLHFGDISYIAIGGLSDSKGIVIFRESGAAAIVARIINVSGGDITSIGSGQTIATGAADYNVRSVVVLSETLAVVVIRDEGTGEVITIAMTISGNTITPGTPLILSETGDLGTTAAALSPTSLIVAIENGSSEARAVVLSVSGTTISEGTFGDATNSGSAAGNLGIAAISSATAILAYLDSNADLRASCLYNIGGGTFTLGEDAIINDTYDIISNLSLPFITKVDSDRVAIIWPTDESPVNIRAVAVRYDGGGNISAGTSTEVSAGVENRWRPAIGSLDITNLVAFYGIYSGSGDAYSLDIRSLDISALTITNNNDEIEVMPNYNGSNFAQSLAIGVLE